MPAGLLILLSLVAMIWSSFMLFGQGGFFILVLVGILLAFLCLAKTVLRGVIYFMTLLVVIVLLLPSICAAREAARRMQCANQMKQLVLALLNYREINGCFPPAYIADKNGKSVHSWRVLILPYCEQIALSKQYSFKEPWDGPNNKKLLPSQINGWACPCDGDTWPAGPYINYVAVVGTNTAWSNGKLQKLTDEQAKTTIMLVEVTGANISWSEPRDLDLDHLAADPTHPDIVVSSKHKPCGDEEYFTYNPRPGAHVALADGSVRFVPGGLLAPERLPELLKIGGFHEELLQADWRGRGELIYWPRCIAVVVWPFAIGCLMVLAVRGRKKPAETAA